MILADLDGTVDSDLHEARSTSRLFAASVESSYRQLRVGLEASKAVSAAADFYWGELEARRRTRRSALDAWLLPLYKWLGGYGVRPEPPLFWLVAMTTVTSVLFRRFHADVFGLGGLVRLNDDDGDPGTPPGYVVDGYEMARIGDALAFVLRSSVSLFSATTDQLTAAGTIALVVVRFITVALLAMTLFALRSRVAR